VNYENKKVDKCYHHYSSKHNTLGSIFINVYIYNKLMTMYWELLKKLNIKRQDLKTLGMFALFLLIILFCMSFESIFDIILQNLIK